MHATPQRTRSRSASVITLLLAVAMATAMTNPAQAAHQPTGPPASIEYTEVVQSGLRSINMTIRLTHVPYDLFTDLVAVECDVSGTPDGQQAVVDTCVVSSSGGGTLRATGEGVSVPGPAAVAAGAARMEKGSYTACVSGTVHFGPLDPETLTASWRCTSGIRVQLPAN